MKESTIHKRMLLVFIFIGFLFFTLVTTIIYFELFGKSKIMYNSYNRRLIAHEQTAIRGNIYDRTGIVLALNTTLESEANSNPIIIRKYPYKGLYSHVIGYSSKIYGKSMIEAKFNKELLALDFAGQISKTKSLFKGQANEGRDLYLTIDHEMQLKARELLGNNHGSVVALNPKTGEVIVMVSTPDFDPNSDVLHNQWPSLIENDTSPLLPRAIMGLYPPGSTYKVITAMAAINQGLEDFRVNDEGMTTIDGKVFSNSSNQIFGDIGLKESITVSSNVFFAELSKILDPEQLAEASEAFGFNKSIDFTLPISKSRMGSGEMNATEFAATTIGQGRLMVTPMQMALVSAGIANDGIMMRPYLVKDYEREKKIGRIADGETMKSIQEMMLSVVEEGTGKGAAVKGYRVAGKTGTAQNERSAQGANNDHAWFIGFAPAEDPTIALAVVLEYQGQGGGQAAAPIAQKLFAQWLNSNK